MIAITDQKGNLLEVPKSNLPLIIYHEDKVYYIKYSKKNNGLYLNTVELDKDKKHG